MNGAGKSTLAHHIMGLLKPTRGTVMIDGQNTQKLTVAQMARTVGLIFQNPNHQLFIDTIEGEIAFGPQNLGWSEERISNARNQILKDLKLSNMEKLDPESLSTGQKQRVAAASVLVMEPKILLLDEPTTGQDQITLEPLMELVAKLNRAGMTVIMITHDMDVALRYASRVVIMADGRILADGSPQEIFLQENVLAKARLALPQLLELTKEMFNSKPIFVSTLDEIEESLSDILQIKGTDHDYTNS
jgi:energy-coupling factor transport system ATP-binding protein